MEEKSKKRTSNVLLLALCWLAYTCSYLGKLGYNANITQIESVYNVSHGTAGMVSTFFFFAYGIGQIINGIFCKKYNVRYVVFGGLLLSGLMNALVGLVDNFSLVKYFWLINGGSLSVLWPSLIRLLSETMEKEEMPRAVIAMGTTVATGTFFVYGLSALFVKFATYTVMFFVAGILLPSIAVLWMIAYPRLVKKKTEQTQEKIVSTEKKGCAGLWIPIIALAFFAVVDNLTKDGLTTWVPMILKDTYGLPDYASILLTMLLPILAVFGTTVAVTLRKKINDFVALCALMFGLSAVFIGCVILCLPTGIFAVTLGSFGLVACLMSGVNNVVTSMAPLFWKDRVSSGTLAGVLNGFCYLGSTLSAYGLGVIADKTGGWTAVFWLLLSLCAISAILGAVYVLTKRKQINQGIL